MTITARQLTRANDLAIKAQERATTAIETRNDLIAQAVTNGNLTQADIARLLNLTTARLAQIIGRHRNG